MSVDPSAGILALLAHDDADMVRMAVSGNHGTPIDVLRRLADDAEDEVRASLAANRATPVDVLRFLSNDFSTRVRRALAGFEWKDEGSGDGWTTRDIYAWDLGAVLIPGNPSVPADVLTVLSTDWDVAAVQCLDLALLVHAEHHGLVRRAAGGLGPPTCFVSDRVQFTLRCRRSFGPHRS